MKIKIDDGINDELALQLILKVVQQGRISKGRNNKKCYCFTTVFNIPEDPDYEYVVYSNGNTKDNCFLVYKAKNKNM